MWNGFYNLKNIEDEETLKSLFKDALSVATESWVDILKGFRRERYDSLTPLEYIKTVLSLKDHNVVVNRKAYHSTLDYAEIGSSTLKIGDNLFLFIHINLEDLEKLVEKYNLFFRA